MTTAPLPDPAPLPEPTSATQTSDMLARIRDLLSHDGADPPEQGQEAQADQVWAQTAEQSAHAPAGDIADPAPDRSDPLLTRLDHLDAQLDDLTPPPRRLSRLRLGVDTPPPEGDDENVPDAEEPAQDRHPGPQIALLPPPEMAPETPAQPEEIAPPAAALEEARPHTEPQPDVAPMSQAPDSAPDAAPRSQQSNGPLSALIHDILTDELRRTPLLDREMLNQLVREEVRAALREQISGEIRAALGDILPAQG